MQVMTVVKMRHCYFSEMGKNFLKESMEVDKTSKKYSSHPDIQFHKRNKVNVKLELTKSRE